MGPSCLAAHLVEQRLSTGERTRRTRRWSKLGATPVPAQACLRQAGTLQTSGLHPRGAVTPTSAAAHFASRSFTTPRRAAVDQKLVVGRAPSTRQVGDSVQSCSSTTFHLPSHNAAGAAMLPKSMGVGLPANTGPAGPSSRAGGGRLVRGLVSPMMEAVLRPRTKDPMTVVRSGLIAAIQAEGYAR
jgi:hypothetical protein